ncbi:hypothetical protein PILCRDRAFT_812360 [Piloderma croceum F 1598]|uniref:Uncharacterized protein n=1 Tax=Piloderma croceum (strain F 1598) TaxID=765440 RepID=A0A0C3G2Y0_PILCF|nr:hypothetical protein PILCRDRAFT_812360 [Piloderma croceum F 1598]
MGCDEQKRPSEPRPDHLPCLAICSYLDHAIMQLEVSQLCPPMATQLLVSPSPPIDLPMSPSTHRRLSSRRGSISASDPFGTHLHLNENPDRSSSSTLTIVRVTSPTDPAISEHPSRRNYLRHGSGSSAGPGSPSTGRQDAPSSRLSFAFSSFSGSQTTGLSANSNNTPRSESPTNSLRPRPSSPNQNRPSRSHSSSQPRLSPDQLLALARHSTSGQHSSPYKAPYADLVFPGSSYGETSPASFTPLAPDVYLPFIDRPAEVLALISSPPSGKLFSLLGQTFPRSKGQPSPSIAALTSSLQIAVDLSAFPEDPTTWTFPELILWLTTVPRTVAPDAFWVHQMRACIHERSELIWERVKGALGVPPELDMEDDDDDDDDGGQELFKSSDITTVRTGEEYLTAQASSDSDHHDDFVSSPIDADSDSDYNPLSLSIENIISTSTPSPITPSGSYTNPPPLSLPSSLGAPSSLSHSPHVPDAGLQNITEDQEETEENPDTPENVGLGKQIKEDYTTAKSLDEAQPQCTIQGLKISTSSLRNSTDSPPSSYRRAYSVNSSPQQPALHPQGSPGHAFSLLSSSPHTRPKSLRSSSFGSLHSSSSLPYDPVGDRVPGNPLFPSNFARLAVGPTLRANNPSLRSPPHPPAPAYMMKHGAGVKRRPPSWAEGWDSVKQEYAVTIDSGSSVGGE